MVAHTEHGVVSDHPVYAASEASQHFLNGAATPPHEEGIFARTATLSVARLFLEVLEP